MNRKGHTIVEKILAGSLIFLLALCFPRFQAWLQAAGMEIKVNTTPQLDVVFLNASNATYDNGITGLTNATTYFRFQRAGGALTALTNFTLTEADATNDKGHYRLVFNATVTNTTGPLYIKGNATGATPYRDYYNVVSWMPTDVYTALGNNTVTLSGNQTVNAMQFNGTAISATPNVNVNQWNGTLVPAPATAGYPDTNAKYWNGTVIPTPATAGIPDVNTKNIANAAVSTTTAQIGVNAVQWNGTAIPTPATAGIPDVNTKNLGNTTQTGRDIGASVLLSNGTGTGQISLSSGLVTLVTNVWDELTASHSVSNSFAALIKADLDTNIGSRSTYAGGAVASVTADVGITQAGADKVWGTTTRRLSDGTNIVLAKGTGITGFNDITVNNIWDELVTSHTITSSFAKLLKDDLDTNIGSRMATFSYTAPDNTNILNSYNILNSGTYGNNALLTAIGTRLATSGYTAPDNTNIGNIYNIVNSGTYGNNALLTAINTRSTYAGFTTADVNKIWDELTSGHSTTGSFGKLLTTDLDTNVGSRMATFTYTAPDNADIVAIKAVTDKILFDASNFVKSACQTIANAAIGTAQFVAGAISSTVAPNLDVAVSSRSNLTAGAVENATWEATATNHNNNGTMGKELNGASSGGSSGYIIGP
jgi:hypothetical protein